MKKFLSMLLVAAMLLSFMPAFSLPAAAADETEEVVIQEPETRAPETKAATQAVGVIDLDGVPSSIAPGAAGDPDIYEFDDDVSITGWQWLNANKQPVTEFVNGETYWLAVTVVPDEGYAFTGTPDTIYSGGKEYELQIVSQQEAVMYICYTAQLTTGDINVIPTGFQEGAPIAGASATVEGKAVLAEIEIKKCEYSEVSGYYSSDVADGNFEPDSLYEIRFILQAMDGYAFDSDRDNFTVNGRWVAFNDDNELSLWWSFCTGEEITEVVLSMPEIAVGTERESVEVTAPAGANYVLDFYGFYDVCCDYSDFDTFQEGHEYELSYTVLPKNGYGFAEDVSVTLNGKPVGHSGGSNAAETYGWVYFSFEPAEMIRLYDLPYEIESGAAEIPEIDDYAGDEVIITNMQWVNADKQPVTAFEEGKVYYLAVTVTPEGFVDLAETPDISVSGQHTWSFEWIDKNTGIVYIRYSLVPLVEIEQVELTLTGLVSGAKKEDVTLTAPENASYILIPEYIYLVGADDSYADEDTIRQDGEYILYYKVVTKEGYFFADELGVYINGVETWEFDSGNSWIDGYMSISLGVNRIALQNLPDSIWEGAEEDEYIWNLEELEAEDSDASITNVQWLGANKQPVTKFENGKGYYLALTLAPKGTKKFIGTPEVDFEWYYNYVYELEIVSETQAILYIYYSLESDTGDLAIQVSGLQEGAKIEDLEVTVSGNATVEEYRVYQYTYYEEDDYYGTDLVTEGTFEAASNYVIAYTLRAKSGYSFYGGRNITVNGEEVYSYSTYGGNLYIDVESYFSTCEKIESIALTVPEVEPGKSFEDLVPTAPADANYTVSYWWYDMTEDWDEPTGTVEAKHKYQLGISLTPKEGYVFAQELTATWNGEELGPYEVGVDRDGLGADLYENYSFLEKITKIELPAMPKSVKKGSTLKTDFKVADSKNYTVSAYWSLNYESVTKATEKGIYTLALTASPKDGYEFAEDAKVYVDGKLAEDFYVDYDYCAVYGTYYVGIEKISKVELTFTEPEDGKPVSTVKVPSKAKYSIIMQVWGQGIDNDVENCEIVETYIKDQYVFLALDLQVKDGYVITDDTLFYLNGKKTTPLSVDSYNGEAYVTFAVGKVSAFKKLATPEVTKSGAALSWEAVAYADAYEVYRATSKSGKYTKVDTVTETTWTDSAAAGKTYYYKVKAVYTADTDKNSSFSSVVSIDYKCEAPVITVANGDTGKPVISWEKVSGAKKYTVYRATSETGKYSKLTTTTKLTYTDTKAKAGTTYFYKVIANASSSKYNSGYSNIVSCGVICGTPTVTVKIDAATGKPSLSWKKVDGAVNYRILRQLPGEETFTEIAVQTGITFADTTAPIDTVCQYQVQALGKTEELNGAVSKTVTATSGIARPAMKTSIDSVSGKPTFTWEAVEGAVKYEIYRSTKSTKGYTLLATVEATSYVDETVAAGKTYYYKMVAIGQVGKSAETAYVKLTGKCAVPTISAQIDADSGKPTISWEKIAGAKQYTVYRATSENGKYSKLKSVKTLSYTDTKATAGTQYFYKVIANASSSKNNSGYSNIVSCNVICGRPTVSIKTDAATGKPVLSWSKVTGAAGYRILRKLPGEESFAVIAEQTAVTLLDTTAPIDTQCVYMVQVLGKTDALDSMLSEEKTVTSGIARPAMKASVDATSGKPTFTWEAVEGAVKYEIYRSTKSTKGYTLLAAVETTSYVDETVAAGKTYYYKMVAIGENGKSAETAYVKLTGKCATPAISVQLHETTGKPVISWEKITGAKQYTVYRATSQNGTYKKLGSTKNLSYTDSKAVPGTEYYYKVVANGSKSSYNSGYSNVTSAVGYAAQPQITLKNDSKGKPVASWKKISEAEKYFVAYVDITDLEDESQLTEQFILENLQYVEVSKKKTSVTLTQAQTGRIYAVAVVAVPKNEEYFAISQIGYVAATCAAPKISGKYLQGYNCGTWKAVEGAEYYAIYRSTKASGNYELLGYIDNDSSFVDLSAVKGKTYYYKVTACTEYTESEFSNYIKLKTK